MADYIPEGTTVVPTSEVRHRHTLDSMAVARRIAERHWADENEWDARDRVCAAIYHMMSELNKGFSTPLTFTCSACGDDCTVNPGLRVRQR